MDDKIRNIQSKFKKVYQECEFLEDKIYKQEGIIFKTHVYKIEDLMNSSHQNKINTITSKIGSDVQYWEMNGKLSAEEKEAYLDEREALDDILHQIHRKILNRKPTFWEELSVAVEKFIVKVMNHLPRLQEILTWVGKQLGRIPYIGGMFPALIYVGDRTTEYVRRALPAVVNAGRKLTHKEE